jgi:hypothetical protein
MPSSNRAVVCAVSERGEFSMNWIMKHPHANMEMLGLIPEFLDERDPRPAREQIDQNYRHGGGWQPFPGFTMLPDGDLSYPGDPPTRLIAETHLRDETIRFYDCSWLAIVQPDGTFEVSRVD